MVEVSEKSTQMSGLKELGLNAAAEGVGVGVVVGLDVILGVTVEVTEGVGVLVCEGL